MKSYIGAVENELWLVVSELLDTSESYPNFLRHSQHFNFLHSAMVFLHWTAEILLLPDVFYRWLCLIENNSHLTPSRITGCASVQHDAYRAVDLVHGVRIN